MTDPCYLWSKAQDGRCDKTWERLDQAFPDLKVSMELKSVFIQLPHMILLETLRTVFYGIPEEEVLGIVICIDIRGIPYFRMPAYLTPIDGAPAPRPAFTNLQPGKGWTVKPEDSIRLSLEAPEQIMKLAEGIRLILLLEPCEA